MTSEKEVFLLMGNVGSGKTTERKALLEKFKDVSAFVSHDEQGKAHNQKYLDLLDEEVPKIIIDLQNPDRRARKRFIEPAKKAGYIITIIDMTCDPRTAYDRVMNRKGHPNLGESSDSKLVLKLLYDYYKKYEKPFDYECNNYNFIGNHDPYMLDLTDKIGNQDYLVVGDIHGCDDEFTKLIIKAHKDEIESTYDYIIACGDLIDRGPKIKQVLNYFINGQFNFSVLGNHEDKFLRYLIGNNVRITEGLQRTIDQCENMDTTDLTLYLLSLPLIIKVKENYIFHAGINPNKSIFRQPRQTLLMARKFNSDDGSFDDRPDSFYWWQHELNPDHYENMNLFFGHDYQKDILVCENKYRNLNIYALDGHCVFGKTLRGVLINE